MNNNTIKAIITAVTGFLSSLLGILYVPVLLIHFPEQEVEQLELFQRAQKQEESVTD